MKDLKGELAVVEGRAKALLEALDAGIVDPDAAER